MSELPGGWQLIRIGDLGELQLGKMLDKAKNQGVPTRYLRNVNVRWGEFDLSELQSVLATDEDRVRYSVRNEDLFICEGGEPGRCAVWRDGDTSLIFQKALHRFRSSGAVLPDWLMYRLKHDAASGALAAVFTGTTIKHLSKEKLTEFVIPVAPLDEQKRIVDKLDALLARVDACRERLDRVPGILKQFRQSVLAAAVTGELTATWRERGVYTLTGQVLRENVRRQHVAYAETTTRGPKPANPVGFGCETLGVDANPTQAPLPSSWVWSSAAELVEPGAEIVYGIVQPGPRVEYGVPYVRGLDIEGGRILENQLLRTSRAVASRYERAALRGGDVLLGIIRATKVAVVPSSLDGANITQGTARFRPSGALRSRYLAAALEAPRTQAWLHRHYRGIDMPGLNLADVRRVPIPLPPLEEQDEIIRRISILCAAIDRINERWSVANAAAERLSSALLARAFRGELPSRTLEKQTAAALLAGGAEGPASRNVRSEPGVVDV